MTKSGLLAGLAMLALAACGDRETLLTGERQGLRGETDLAPRDSARAIDLPAQVSRSDWTHVASEPDHNIPHAVFARAPDLLFSVDIGHGEGRRDRITADPVVSDGRVFTVDARAQVRAHGTGGQALWQTDLVPPGERAIAASAGLAVSDGTLYASTAYGDLVALDVATGARRWTQDIGAPASGAPTVVGDAVYVVGRDATAWAIDTDTGRVLWTEQGTPSEAGVLGGAAPAVSGDLAVLPFASRELVGVLRQGGTRLWTARVSGSRTGTVYGAFGDISGDPVIAGGRVYAGSPTGRTNAFDLRSGDQLWSADEGAMSPVLVAGNSVFAVTDQAELVRLDAGTGTRIWGTELPYYRPGRLRTRSATVAHYGPVLAGGHLWIASADERLRGFDPETGGLVAEVPLPGGAATNPVLAGQTLYVVNSDAELLAFR